MIAAYLQVVVASEDSNDMGIIIITITQYKDSM